MTLDNIADMTTTSQDKSSWQSKVDMLLDVLIASAQTITYDEMATQADIPAPHRIHQLTSYLETLIEDDGAQQRPIRASVVVSKVRLIPAPGFFDALRPYIEPQNHLDEPGLHQHLLRALNPDYPSATLFNQE